MAQLGEIKLRTRIQVNYERIARKLRRITTHNMTSTKEILLDYGLWSTTHGVPHISRVKYAHAKIFWALVLFGALLMCGMQLKHLYYKFLQREKKTSIELDFRAQPFPAITFCSLNPYKLSMAETVPELDALITAYQSSIRSRKLSKKNRFTTGNLLKKRIIEPIIVESKENLTNSNRSADDDHNLPDGTNTTTGSVSSLISRSFCLCDDTNKCTRITNQNETLTTTCLCDNTNHCVICDTDSCVWKKGNPSEATGVLRVRRALINLVNIEEASGLEGLVLTLTPCFCDLNTHCDVNHFPKALLGHCLCSQYNECKICTARSCEWQVLTTPRPTPSTTAVMTTTLSDTTTKSVTSQPKTVNSPSSANDAEQTIPPKVYDFQNDTNEMTARTKIQENLIFVVANLNASLRERIGYEKEELIIQCAFDAKACQIARDFEFYLDATYGNCFTFNANAEHIKFHTRRAGPLNGLQVVIYTNLSDSLLLTSDKTGARVVIHDQKDDPFPDSYGYTVATGTATSFAIKKLTTKRQSKPYGDCIKHKSEVTNFYYNGSYSVEGCVRSCVQRQIVDRCKCGDPSFNLPNIYRFCDNSDKSRRACIYETVATADSHCDNCKVPCEQTEYAATISTLRWDEDGEESKCKCDSTAKAPDDMQGLFVEVFYEQLSEQIISESPAYPSINLLSDVAGQVGFWVGMSVISMVEVLVFLIKLAWFFLTYGAPERENGRTVEEEKNAVNEMKAKRMSLSVPAERKNVLGSGLSRSKKKSQVGSIIEMGRNSAGSSASTHSINGW